MYTLITVIHVFTCVLLILVVLIQSGKGAEISASFGGSSQTVFGSSGGANFFTRFTSAAAAIFMVTSLTLTVLQGRSRKSVFEDRINPAPISSKQNAIPGTQPGQTPGSATSPAIPPGAGAANSSGTAPSTGAAPRAGLPPGAPALPPGTQTATQH